MAVFPVGAQFTITGGAGGATANAGLATAPATAYAATVAAGATASAGAAVATAVAYAATVDLNAPARAVAGGAAGARVRAGGSRG